MNIKSIDKNMIESRSVESNISWFNVNSNNFEIHGLHWYQKNLNYHRLPDDYYINDNINNLSKHPAGAYISFKTNSNNIYINAELSSMAYMPHMTAIAQIGFDLYIKHNNKYLFLSTTKVNKSKFSISMIENLDNTIKEFRLYFPLYIDVKKVKIGISLDANIFQSDDIYDENSKKIVCYGTSITQGGCAGRPGMNYSSILGRITNYEVFNFGFSGNCFLEEEMAELISSINNVKFLIIEAEANAGQNSKLMDNLSLFIDIIQRNSCKTKIILVSGFPQTKDLIYQSSYDRKQKNFQFQKQISKGKNIFFINGNELLEQFYFDDTVDGVHLTDLSFYHIAVFLKNMINQLENK